MPDGKFIEKKLVHPECFPIEIPENDSFFSKFGQRCMPIGPFGTDSQVRLHLRRFRTGELITLIHLAINYHLNLGYR
jgi:hypothetical protein